jgi:serine/threonine-protein kinase HipA
LIERALKLSHRGALPRALDDLDFLLGVSDSTRHGALRFQIAGEFYASGPTPPPQLDLLALAVAAKSVESDTGSKAVLTLLDVGSHSLGGARPKASVLLPGGNLGIAKFSATGDQHRVIALEAVAHDMAEAMGITTVWRDLVRVADQDVLVLQRFDRQGSNRIPYVSAMTLLGKRDHEACDYVELQEAVRGHSPTPHKDVRELFDRVVLSVVLHNTDDHLRNHGFLRAPSGWALSPIFDVNPTLEPTASRATSIAGAVRMEDEPEGVLELAARSGLSAAITRARIEQAVAVAARVKKMASRLGIDRASTELLHDIVAERSNALAQAVRKMSRPQPMALTSTRGRWRVAAGHPHAGRFAKK